MKLRDTSHWVGLAGFRTIDWDTFTAEFGIIIHPKYQRLMLGTEVHFAFLRHAIEVLGMKKIFFMTDERNEAMRGFYQKYAINLECEMKNFLLVPKRNKEWEFQEGE